MGAIGFVSLLPYSKEHLVVIYNCDYDYVKENILYYYDEEDFCSLKEIKDNLIKKNALLRNIDMCKKNIDTIKLSNEVNGVYITNIDDEGFNFRCIILRGMTDSNDTDWYITLAHETLHLCQEFLSVFMPERNEDEAEAYFHSYIMREIVNMIKE